VVLIKQHVSAYSEAHHQVNHVTYRILLIMRG